MDCLKVKVKARTVIALYLLAFCFAHSVKAFGPEYSVHKVASYSDVRPEIVTLEHGRNRREVPASPATLTPSNTTLTQQVPTANVTHANNTDDINRTTNFTSNPTAAVTQVPPLQSVNVSGDITANIPKVSDPIMPNDNLPDVFKETPEVIQAEQNIKNLTYDHHSFYNSSFIGNKTYFNEYWSNITKHKLDIHPILSNSHRRATTLKLSFDFPFYGHNLRNITVATGGFIYTGEHVHNWLAATQYIAPLMANFDTTVTNESLVKLYDDGEKFTALWENVNLQEEQNLTFTFAVTLYKNGDIVFAYKDIPIGIENITDVKHPVKVGISDAYLTDRILFYVRRKTIYEYHRVSFKNYEITNGTILKLVALPTCVQYDTCESCVNHETGFNCSWCEQIHRCSSGTDRNKQDWLIRNCEKSPIYNETSCRVRPQNDSSVPRITGGSDTVYVTDTHGVPYHDAVFKINTSETESVSRKSISSDSSPIVSPSAVGSSPDAQSPIGGAVAALVIVALVTSFAAWIFYAFKNPHTRSGQILIKYRPSQWHWRRGEARYTAATIHM